MKLRMARFAIGLAAVALAAGNLAAQDRSRGIDPRDILRSADDNGDGVIEQSELGQRSGYYVRRAAERIGMDPNGKLPADKILAALEAMKNEEASSNSSGGSSGGSGFSGGSSGSSSRPAAPPNGPQAFGEADKTVKVPGFDVPLSVNIGEPLDKRYDSRVIEYVNDMLRERDANKNGILEKSEWTGRWSTPPEESDTNKDGVLSKDELCARIAKRFGIGNSGSSGSSGGSSGSGGQSYTWGSSSGGSSGGDSSRFRGYAEGMIKHYDKSKNGMLEKDEWKDMRSEHQSSDANKDGVITIDELAAHLQSYSERGSSGGNTYIVTAGPGSGVTSSSGQGNSGSSGSGSSGFGSGGSSSRWGDRGGWGSRSSSSGDSNKSAAGQTKKSYRFLSPTERLPKGMPDWFLRGDADGDGQVSMVEYSATWNDQIAAEFQKYDLDSDGLVTPEECQKAESSKSLKK
jgi:Ca2+-binding EF-hand superfamily protein